MSSSVEKYFETIVRNETHFSSLAACCVTLWLTASGRSLLRRERPQTDSGSCMGFTVRRQQTLSVRRSSLLVRYPNGFLYLLNRYCQLYSIRSVLANRVQGFCLTGPFLLSMSDFDFSLSSFFSVFGRPFVKRFALCYAIGPLSCLSVYLSVCNVRALWPNGWADQDETWRASALATLC